jgi:replication-associated recombination protein RarA
MIGHHTARRILERDLPPAALLHGPPSIGKWTLALHLADFHRVHPVDRWLVDHTLSIGTARLVTHFAARSARGSFKMIIIRLDDASRAGLNALLKTLEEPPPNVKFLLVSADRTLPTVASRCTVFEMGLLTIDELKEIYGRAGVPKAKAARAAEFARGQVERGYLAESADQQRLTVITLAKALTTGDRELFNAVFEHWDGRCGDYLTALLTESLTHRWHTFTENDTNGLHLDRPRLWRMTAAISRLPAARPKLGVRAALEPFLSR